MFENVTMQLQTTIRFEGKDILIPDYIQNELGDIYNFNSEKIVDTKFYGVPQQRKRAIFLMTRKDLGFTWEIPAPSEKIITLREAIGDLPSLDPLVKEKEFRKYFPDYERKAEEGRNYDKQDNISDTTKYEDHFVAENRLIAISKSGRSMDSEDVQNFLNATERGIDVQLFVRKNKDDKISKEFYYLGRVIATGNAKQFVMPNTDKTAVEIEWELETPVREDIYQYIVNE